MYDQLVAADKLYQDDGALVREFGIPKPKLAQKVDKVGK